MTPRKKTESGIKCDPNTGLPVLPDGYWWDVDDRRITICEWMHAPPNFKIVHRTATVTSTSGEPAAMKAAALLLYGQVRFRLEREAQARKDYA